MKGDNIAERLLGFAANVLSMTARLPKNAAGRHVMTQLVRAASGGGSNYEEARAAESRADFVHKVSIAAKETREALYWLRLIERAQLLETPVAVLVREADELVAILTSSARTAKRIVNARNRKPEVVNGGCRSWAAECSADGHSPEVDPSAAVSSLMR
jgi:four helix bundle protein